MKKILLYLISISLTTVVIGQVAINTTGNNPSPSAMLDISSTNKGMLMPRMTAVQRKAIPNPEAGLFVYDLDHMTPYMFDGEKWRPLVFVSDKKVPLIERSPTTAQTNVRLGVDVAISGDYAIAGAMDEDSGSLTDIGAAYVYHKENGVWRMQQKLFPNSSQGNQRFGFRVAIENDIAVVSAPYFSHNGLFHSGIVYVFKRSGNTWTQQQVLQMQTPQANAEFGSDVAIQGNRILVGASGLTVNGLNKAGGAFLYTSNGNNFNLLINFKALTPSSNDYYGFSVDLYGNEVVIGAPHAAGSNGAVYAYSYAPAIALWAEQVLNSSDPGAMFGYSVSIYNTTLLAGRPWSNNTTNGNNFVTAGGTTFYKKLNGSWTYSTAHAGAATWDRLGFSVAITDDYRLEGVPFFGTSGKVDGISTSYMDTDEGLNAEFGTCVAISGSNFIVGAPQKNYGKGAVFFGTFE